VISLFSILGVGLGVAALIVVIGVMNGFSSDLKDKILGVNAHIIVTSLAGGIEDHKVNAQLARGVDGVEGVMPFVYSEVMLSSRTGVKGAALRGIDPESADNVLALSDDLIEGSDSDLAQGDGPPGIIIGEELAMRLGLFRLATVNLLSPAGQRTAAGFTPKIKPFRVVGIFDTGMYEFDSSLAYVSLEAAQELMGFKSDLVSGLEIRVADVDKADEIAPKVSETLGGHPFYARSWMQMNENLFAALELEKTAMFVILVMIVLVGSFSIVTSLIMLVKEKTKDIAILMSMGAQEKNIRNIFMLQGTVIGLIGTALGYGVGLLACWLLEKYQFIKLPRDVYALDHLPVLLEWPDLTIIGLAAFALCFSATIYPARQASKLEPAEALRYE
jgi:lipoprotein-releasing system permease protein